MSLLLAKAVSVFVVLPSNTPENMIMSCSARTGYLLWPRFCGGPSLSEYPLRLFRYLADIRPRRSLPPCDSPSREPKVVQMISWHGLFSSFQGGIECSHPLPVSLRKGRGSFTYTITLYRLHHLLSPTLPNSPILLHLPILLKYIPCHAAHAFCRLSSSPQSHSV